MALVRSNVSTTTKAPGAPTSFTSAAFTPPDNSLVVVFAGLQSSNQSLAPSITDNLGTHLVYTQRAIAGPDTSAFGHFSVMWTAPVTIGASMTVTVGNMPSDGTAEGIMHIFTYTGHNIGAPVGATVSGTAAFNAAVDLTLSAAPAATSEVIAGASDDTGGGVPAITAGTGWTEQFHVSDANNTDSQTQTRTSSTSTNVHWNSNANGTNGCAVAIEIQVAVAAGGLSIPVHNFKIDKFKTPSRSMGPNAGLFQVKAYPIAVSADTPASYVSRPFPPVQWNLNTPLLRGTAQDFSSSAVETNPHWQGRTYPPQWAITRSLLLPRAVVESSSAVETNPHWKPGTLPPQWAINRLLAQNTAQDFSSSAVETNPHWAARTWPIQWVVNASLVRGVTGDITTVVTTPDAPPSFIPRTWLPQWAINIPLHQNTAQDFSASDVETNPHWQSRSWPVAWSTQAALWQGAASDTPFAVIDTPVYFIPRTFPAQWLPNRALGQNTAQDFSASAVETNVQFRSRTWPLQWALQASLLRGTAQDFSTLPPATQPVYARYGASHGIGALSAIPGEIPS